MLISSPKSNISAKLFPSLENQNEFKGPLEFDFIFNDNDDNESVSAPCDF